MVMEYSYKFYGIFLKLHISGKFARIKKEPLKQYSFFFYRM